MRITTEDPTGRFNVSLNEGFTLPPNSTIALQSANFTRETPSFQIGPDNDTFRFQTDTGNEREVRIRDLTNTGIRRYDRSSFYTLMTNMSASINASLYPMENSVASDDFGVQCEVATDATQHVVIDFRRTPYLRWTGQPAPPIDHQIITHNVTRSANRLIKTVVNSKNKNGVFSGGYCVDKLDFGMGGAVMSCTLNKYTAADQTGNQADGAGFIMGIITDDKFNQLEHQGNAEFMSENDFVCAIIIADSAAFRADNLATVPPGADAGGASSSIVLSASDSFGRNLRNMSRNKRGVKPVNCNDDTEARLNTAAATGGTVVKDQYKIEIRNGCFVMVQYSFDAAAPTVLKETVLEFDLGPPAQDTTAKPLNKVDPNQRYHAFYGLYGSGPGIIPASNTTILTEVEVVNSPFVRRPIETANLLTYETEGFDKRFNVTATETVYNLNFSRVNALGERVNNVDLSNFLGFGEQFIQNPLNTPGRTALFRAPNTARAALRAETYLIQLISRSVESYDSVSSGKENTIYTIVKDVLETGVEEEINFNSNFPIQIQLKNRNEILLRDISARIVDSDIQEILLLGRSQLSFLFGE